MTDAEKQAIRERLANMTLDFIAHAPADLAALLAEVERLEKERDSARDLLTEAQKYQLARDQQLERLEKERNAAVVVLRAKCSEQEWAAMPAAFAETAERVERLEGIVRGLAEMGCDLCELLEGDGLKAHQSDCLFQQAKDYVGGKR